MRTQTAYQRSLVNGDKRILTSLQPAKKESIYGESSIEPLSKASKKGLKVFLVDDDLMYLVAMEHFLLQYIPTLKIRIFQTGESSLKHLEKYPPDIVILDYFLDSEVAYAKNGVDILKKIKALHPKVKVVMLSRQNDIKVVMNCIRYGASDYISKGESKVFVKIKNVLLDMAENLGAVGKIEKRMRIFKIINCIIFVLLILFYLFGHK
jgi:response regulator RpfG family c-di-GMP phosphodiesterase